MRTSNHVTTPRAALLILAVATACGSSDTGASTDGGRPDGKATPADTGARSTDGHGGDTGAPEDARTSTDAKRTTDAESRTAPTVLSTTPLDAATGVALNAHLSATFSEAMAPATLTPTTFTLTSGSPPVAVAGTVVYASSRAVFWPSESLAGDTSFTATITTAAMSASGLPMGADYSWGFATGSTVAAGVPVDLGTAGQYVILAKTAISSVSASAVTGDIGISPAAATYITGFSLIADASNVFATSSQVTGKVYAADYSPPTPANLTTAIGDMETAFTAAAGRAPDVTGLGAGSIGGMTLPAGVYKWGTGLLLRRMSRSRGARRMCGSSRSRRASRWPTAFTSLWPVEPCPRTSSGR